MKKFVAVLFVMAVAALPQAFAQAAQGATGSSYINVSVERIWPSSLGYVVRYRVPGNGYATAYLPVAWFNTGDGRGEALRLPAGNSWPSMTVFYQDGQFDRVRLYVHRSRAHESWGTLPQDANLESEFANVQSVDLQF